VPIITLTPIAATARRLALAWGQHCVLTPNADDLEHMIDTACQFASSEGFAEDGQRIIITVGVPLGAAGATNMLRVAEVRKKS
jgi:pyruvate kinase